MNILVVGRGGREHAIVHCLSKSRLVEKIYCAPGNAGIAGIAECIPIEETEINLLADFALENEIDLTVVGPEAPLVAGIVDEFQKKGLKIFGPSKYAALLEGSKVFSKKIMSDAGVPTANYLVFNDPARAMAHVKSIAGCVVKADGLAAGKGVFVCTSPSEALDAVKRILIDHEFGSAGNQIIVEELLGGEEASMLAFCDGTNAKLMVSCQDHKRIFDDDKGPNTGGMGAYSPAIVVTREVEEVALNQVILPVLGEMNKRGTPYVGVLYAGLMVKGNNVKVLEFNARFGDPETQVILPRLETDLVSILLSCIEGRLSGQDVKWSKKAATCVVMASGGYPGKYEKGVEINGLAEAGKVADAFVFHAGTSFSDGKIVTDGGRVLGVTAIAPTVAGSIKKAYEAVSCIKFSGMQYRKDIGKKALLKRK